MRIGVYCAAGLMGEMGLAAHAAGAGNLSLAPLTNGEIKFKNDLYHVIPRSGAGQ